MSEFSFGKSSRLLKAEDFQAVFDAAEFKASTGEILFLARRGPSDQARLGLVIGKRNIRLAADRNLIKRIIRESFRHKQSELSGLDVIVLARRNLDQLNKRAIRASCDACWKKLIRRAGKPTPTQSDQT